jgi:alkanesulfonate monooxygenase SsuD/methylene tetrahydromethanopterin reductase-like flavin-dependent oxidoreductase (luciferase family)
MRYGLFLPNFGPFGCARRLAELARDAEAAGWDGFFIWDHIARAWLTDVVDPWVALAAIAMTTERLRIGALVTPLPRRRPWKVARETVSLDRLSEGRLVFGVGTGGASGSQVEWENFGEETDPKARGTRLDEGLAILTGLWSGTPFSFAGKFLQVQESCFLPTPVQSPRIPIWVAGYWPHRAPFRRAARWDGMFPLFEPGTPDSPAQLEEVIRYVHEQRRDSTPFDVVYAGQPTPGNDPTRAAELTAPYSRAGATWWLECIYPSHYGGEWQGEWPVAAMRERIVQGPPAR